MNTRTLIKWTATGILAGFLAYGCSDDNDSPDPTATGLQLKGTENTEFPRTGGDLTITIESNRNWSAIRQGEWLEIQGGQTGSAGTSEIKLHAGENEGPTSRTGRLIVKAGQAADTVEFSQPGLPQIVVGKKTIPISDAGGNIDVVVNTNITQLKATPQNDWLKVVKTPYQLVSQMFTVEVKPNSGAARTGQVVFSSESTADTLVVEQSGFTVRYEEQNNKLTVSAITEEAWLKFRTNASWTVEWPKGKAGWISGVEPGSGEGNIEDEVKITFTLTPNEAGERTCPFNIVCGGESQPYHLKQTKWEENIDGNRETDSLILAKFYHSLTSKPSGWDLENKPMRQWGTDGDVQLNSKGRVIKLYLHNMQLNEIPEILGDLPYLTSLKTHGVTFNDVTFPSNLVNLEVLKLSGKGTIILQDLSRYEKLTELQFWGLSLKNINMLEDLPSVEEVRYEFLNLGAHPTAGEPFPSVEKWDNLKTFFAIYVNATGFPKGLGNRPHLKEIDITNCKYLNCGLPDLFTDNPKLFSLELSKNALSGELPDALFSAPQLAYVWLNDNNLTGQLSAKLCDSKIGYFSVFNNMLGGEGQLLDTRIMEDPRWGGVSSGNGSGANSGWFGPINICMQQPGFGWDNCDVPENAK